MTLINERFYLNLLYFKKSMILNDIVNNDNNNSK